MASQYIDKGEVLIALRRYEGAVENFERAMKLSPDAPWILRDNNVCIAYVNAGQLLSEKENYKKAINYFNRVLNSDNDFLTLADLIDPAFKIPTDNIVLSDYIIKALNWKSYSLLKLNNKIEAQGMINIVLRYDPNNKFALDLQSEMTVD